MRLFRQLTPTAGFPARGRPPGTVGPTGHGRAATPDLKVGPTRLGLSPAGRPSAEDPTGSQFVSPVALRYGVDPDAGVGGGICVWPPTGATGSGTGLFTRGRDCR